MSLLKDSVPPVDLQRVALFRAVCKKFEKKAGLPCAVLSIGQCQIQKQSDLAIKKPFHIA